MALYARFYPARTFGQPDTADCLPERASRVRADQDRQLSHRLRCEPDLICADSGSCDVGPVPLGADISSSPLQWQVDDLEEMLLGSRRLGVPMIVGSAGDTGTNSRVDLFVGIIRDLAKKHGLARFRIGYFYSEVEREALRRRIVAGHEVAGLDGRPPLDLATLDATERVVAMAGIHPHLKLLDQGADVIIGGRSSDCAIFAAPAIHRGFPEGLAYFYGKVLECASFCAEPYAGNRCSARSRWMMSMSRSPPSYPSSAARSRRSPAMRCTSGPTPSTSISSAAIST
jgi:hypothetical protein